MKSLLFLLLLSMPVLAQSPKATPAAMPGPTRNCVTYYPRIAVRLGLEGVATLAFQVTSSGAVTNVTVKKSSGHQALDDASVNCVQQWRYNPATNNGTPAGIYKEVDIAWRLNDRDGRAVPLLMIERAALDCIKKAQPSDEALAKANTNTVAQIQFHDSDAPSVELISPSGNPDLDNLVIGCLNHLPPNIAIRFRMGFVIPFSWKVDAQPNTGLPPAAAPK